MVSLMCLSGWESEDLLRIYITGVLLLSDLDRGKFIDSVVVVVPGRQESSIGGVKIGVSQGELRAGG